GVDAAHAVREQHRAGQDEGGIGVDGPPLRARRLQLQVELRAGFRQGAAVQLLAERHSVPGIPRVDGVGNGHGPSRRTTEVAPSRLTTNRTGTRSASAATWVTRPTMRSLSAASRSSVVATVSRVSGSRVPNPSSRNMEFRSRTPAESWTTWR